MKHWISSFLLALGLASVSMPGARAETVVIAFTLGAPPYVFESGDGAAPARDGIWIDIYREALAYRGHVLEPLFTNYNRAETELRMDRADGVALFQDRLSGLHASEEAIHFRNYAFEQPGGTEPIESLADLAGRGLVSWHGAETDLGPAFQAVVGDLSYYREVASQEKQITLFLRRRIDFTIVDESIFRFLVRKNGEDPDAFTAHDIVGGYLRFSAGFKSEAIRDDFNAGLRHLKETGRYDEIYDFYTNEYTE